MLGKRIASALLLAGAAAACASESGGGASPSTTPANAAPPQSIGAARAELEERAREVDSALSDCQLACKALASLERAADHLCLVSEPEECTDARHRVDRARQALNAHCGGC